MTEAIHSGTAPESDSGTPLEKKHGIALTVNGIERRAEVPARRLLSDCLRHDLGLTGTHVGCEHGVCGACTVLVGGVAMRSCLLLAVSVDGEQITTVEGLANTAGPDGELSPVQQGFADCHGLQCGFCTPGFLTTITAGLAENPDPTPEQARELISGNLCRCTGYQNIVAAVLRAAELGKQAASGPGKHAASESGKHAASEFGEQAGSERGERA